LNKNSFESKKYYFGIYCWKYPGYVSREKPSKIENGAIAVKAMYQGYVQLTTPMHLLLSITYFFKVDEAKKSTIDSYYLTKGKKERIDSEK
jgi:hypothetical protein